MQYTLVFIVLVLCVGYIAWRIYRQLSDHENPCQGCKGCELSKKTGKNLVVQKIVLPLHSLNNKVPWMSGLVNGLQNRLRRFESARHLKSKVNRKRVHTTLFFYIIKYCTSHIASTRT